MARGRNRRNDRDAPDGQLRGSNLAHAEINALTALPPGDFGDHVLFSTLEPCFLCTAALRYSHVGTVRYAAPDPYWNGVERMAELNANIAQRWTRRDGPLGGPLQGIAVLLHLVATLERGNGAVADAHEDAMPQVTRLARRLATAGVDQLRAMSLDEAIYALRGDLT